MKDFQIGMSLVRCNILGDLYLIITSPSNWTFTPSPKTFAILSPSLWHDRSAHQGALVSRSLSKSNLIQCDKFYSFPLGKQVKLLF